MFASRFVDTGNQADACLVPVALSPLALYPTVSVSLDSDAPTTSSDFVAYDQSGVLIPTLVVVANDADFRMMFDALVSPGAE